MSLDWVHPRIVDMTGVEAETCDFAWNVFGNAIELVLELNIAAGMRVDNRADVVAIARQFGDGADVGNHPVPGLRAEARSPPRVSSRVVTLVVAPVHHSEVRRSEALAWMSLGSRQSRL